MATVWPDRLGNYWVYVSWLDLCSWLAVWGVGWTFQQMKEQPFGVLLRIVNHRLGAVNGAE